MSCYANTFISFLPFFKQDQPLTRVNQDSRGTSQHYSTNHDFDLIHLVNSLAVAIRRLRDATGLLRIGLGHGRTPVELVLDLSELDALELCKQLDADGAGVLLAGRDVGDLFQLALRR